MKVIKQVHVFTFEGSYYKCIAESKEKAEVYLTALLKDHTSNRIIPVVCWSDQTTLKFVATELIPVVE